jgi:hypothetical protein
MVILQQKLSGVIPLLFRSVLLFNTKIEIAKKATGQRNSLSEKKE